MNVFISNSGSAVFYMVAATLCITVVNLSAMHLLASYGLLQVLLIRASVGFILLSAFFSAVNIRPDEMLPSSFLTTAIRAVLELGMFGFFLMALEEVTLSLAVSVAMLGPPLVVFLSSILLKEPMYWHRIVATMISFAAAMLIINPVNMGASLQSILYLLMSVICFSLNAVLARKFRHRITPVSVAFYTHGIMVLILLPLVIGSWEPISWAKESIVIVLMSISSLLGIFLFSFSYKVGHGAFVSMFYYSEILWAMLIDFLMFQFIPSSIAILGVLLMIGAGLLSALSEHKQKSTDVIKARF